LVLQVIVSKEVAIGTLQREAIALKEIIDKLEAEVERLTPDKDK